MKIILIILMMIPNLVFAYGNTFSCSSGEPACLDSNDKICPSYSKCVDYNSVFFDSNTCAYDGFVCKSDLDSCADKYRGLASEYNDLLAKHNELVDDYNRLLKRNKNLVSCLSYSNTMDELKSCL